MEFLWSLFQSFSGLSVIYVLLLEDNKYYIGKTNDLERRISEHEEGYGSAWTETYRMIELLEVSPELSIYDEENKTREYMEIFGKDNVRGGLWVQMILPDWMENPYLLSRHREGRCARCGFSNHFVLDCYSTRTGDGGPILD